MYVQLPRSKSLSRADSLCDSFGGAISCYRRSDPNCTANSPCGGRYFNINRFSHLFYLPLLDCDKTLPASDFVKSLYFSLCKTLEAISSI